MGELQAITEAKGAAESGDFAKARNALARAIDADPNDCELHALMSWYTAKTSSLDPHERARLVQHHLGISFEIKPDNHFGHFYQGRIWADQGNSQRARTSFESALKARPDFTAAKDAMARLDAKPDATPEPTGTRTTGMYRKAKHRHLMLLGFLAVLTGGATVASFFLSGKPARNLAAQLGTSLPLISISRGATELHIDVGPAWSALQPNEKEQEAGNIARGAMKLQLKRVFVYSNSKQVAELNEEKVCLDPKCLSLGE